MNRRLLYSSTPVCFLGVRSGGGRLALFKRSKATQWAPQGANSLIQKTTGFICNSCFSMCFNRWGEWQVSNRELQKAVFFFFNFTYLHFHSEKLHAVTLF